MIQNGQSNENPGMTKLILKLAMLLMKLIAMLKGHQEGRLRRWGESVQILILILLSKS
jgi:hypothetical protein